MIAVRRIDERDWPLWTALRNAVEVDNPTTVDDVRQGIRVRPETTYWIAEVDGEPAGCSFASVSSVPGRGFVLPRVHPDHRGRGVGTALLGAGLERVRELGCTAASSRVDGSDGRALRFAARHGFVEVDREVELVRSLRTQEPVPVPPPGVELVEVAAGARDELRALVAAGVADTPVAGGLGEGFTDEVMDELCDAVFVVSARVDGHAVGLAGLLRHGARTSALEHAFTTVLREQRGRGVARALKQACVHWAAGAGYRELVTWTQRGNAAMQAVNEAVGFERGRVSVTVEAPLG